MIMADEKFATIMKQQEEDEVQKLMEKEQRAMSSMPTGKALLPVQRFLSLHNFLQYYIPHNLGVASKVNNLGNRKYVFLFGLFTASTSGIYSFRK